MATADIVTGQYVRISQTAASVGDRIVARIIDYVVIFAYSFLMFNLLYNALMNLDFGQYDTAVRVLLYTILVFLPTSMYSLVCETFFHGQSMGKRFRHIRVVSIDGSQPTIGQLTIRWLFLMIDVWVSCIGILPIALSKRHQRFGDMAAGTMVIHEDDYQQWHSALDEFYWLTPDYKPAYTQAERLSDGQANLIDRTLHGGNGNDFDQVERLANKVAQFLNVKPKEDKVTFLTKILHDYQYYSLNP